MSSRLYAAALCVFASVILLPHAAAAKCTGMTVTSRGTGMKVPDAIKAAQAEWPARAREANFQGPWAKQGKIVSLACVLQSGAVRYQYECTLVAQPCAQ